MNSTAVYLDYNATSPIRSEVSAVVAHELLVGGNPSSVHRFGRLARSSVDKARNAVSQLVSAFPESVIFTSGGTESNSLAIESFVSGGIKNLFVMSTEHDSVLGAAYNSGARVHEISVLPSGIINLNNLRSLLIDFDCAGVVVQLANNETGILQPISEVADISHQFGALVHCDAVQAPGRIEVNVNELCADTYSLSSHKIGGPQGVGALIALDLNIIKPQLIGGGQEQGLRAGTENVPGISGFGYAASQSKFNAEESLRLSTIRDNLESYLLNNFPSLVVIGSDVPRLPNTTCFLLPGLESETQVIAMDISGIAISAGAACSSGKVGPSHVLKSMGINSENANCAIRLSFGWATSAEEIDRFISAWSELALRKMSNLNDSIAL